MADHTFEPEFDDPPPRDVPAELRSGPFARRRWNEVVGFLTAAILTLALSQLPIIQRWGLFFLPFAYLDWIGCGLILLTSGLYLYHQLNRGPYKLFENGSVVAGRILNLELRPTAFHDGQAAGFRYFALVEFTDPETGEVRQSELASDQLSAGFKDNWELTYAVGDTVTLLYMPGRLDKTLSVYGFLGIRSDAGLIRRRDKPPSSPLKNALVVAAVFLFIFGMLWNLYALYQYKPVEFSVGQGIAAGIGALTLGVGMIVFLWLEMRANKMKVAAANEAAVAEGKAVEVPPTQSKTGAVVVGIIVVLGALLMGALTFLCWCWTLNAWLDDSPAEFRPVVIQGMKQTTHKVVFRTYEIEYRFADDPAGEKHDFSTTPDDMQRFVLPVANADLRAGAFGWRRLRGLEPAFLFVQPPPGK